MNNAIHSRKKYSGAAYVVRYWLTGERKAREEVIEFRMGQFGDSREDCAMTAARQGAFQQNARRIEVHGSGGVQISIRQADGRYIDQWVA